MKQHGQTGNHEQHSNNEKANNEDHHGGEHEGHSHGGGENHHGYNPLKIPADWTIAEKHAKSRNVGPEKSLEQFQ